MAARHTPERRPVPRRRDVSVSTQRVPFGTPEALSRGLVLIVDDDPVFTLLARETLEQNGFETLIAGDVDQGWQLFEERRPDLLLLDVDVSGASGFDLCRRILSAPRAFDVPIVMVTGHNDTLSIERAYKVGAADFISKPVLWPTLPHRVGFILRARKDMRSLRSSERRNRALLQALPDSIYRMNQRGIILEQLAGGESPGAENLIGADLDQLLPANVASTARASLPDAVARGQRLTLDFDDVGNGHARAFEARLLPQSDGTLLMVIRDATDRKRTEARIRRLAYYDTLTGLPNRQLFQRNAARSLDHAREKGGTVAVLYLDLDRFKRVNDNLGHAVGDALLKNVARRLEGSVGITTPAVDSTVSFEEFAAPPIGRLSGDEFVVLLSHITDVSQVDALANEIRRSLAEPFECEGHSLVVTPSIGIALYPGDGADIEDLLIKADMAMYRAKEQGRNGYAFYGESLAIRSLGRLELENELRRAFEAGEFEIHFQPKIDLKSGSVVGVEALMRWHHFSRGWIAPDKFIPIAEETGMIGPMGDWVIREACKLLKAWDNIGLSHLTVAVNVSVRQFAKADFVDSVLSTLQKHAVGPNRIELEITESLLMRNVAETTGNLKRLAAAGVGVSIDDFGTGYSSLGYLKQFTVHSLKIDRSFVKDLTVSSDDKAICSAIIALARELRLKVIAEGVESVEQLNFLRLQNCDQVQGYLFSKPIPAAELETWIKERNARQSINTRRGAERNRPAKGTTRSLIR
jgi:diguanylate cyclase (GGDEF)-like protein